MTTPSRRSFLKALLAVPLVALLPVPQSARAAVALPALTHDQLTASMIRAYAPAIRDMFFTEAPILTLLRSKAVVA